MSIEATIQTSSDPAGWAIMIFILAITWICLVALFCWLMQPDDAQNKEVSDSRE